MPAPNKTALVLLADEQEEIELVTIVDVLRRAEITVTVAGLSGTDLVTCHMGTRIKPDMDLKDAIKTQRGHFDIVILPGGPGCKAFVRSEELRKLLVDQKTAGRYIAAICAAPANVFPAFNIGQGHAVTCYPSNKTSLEEHGTFKFLDQDVVVDGNIITSQGPGTALAFSLAIVKEFCGQETADKLKHKLLVK